MTAIVRLLILTGQRREEVAAMTWDELRPTSRLGPIPASRAKNGVAHIVPLSPQAQRCPAGAPATCRLFFAASPGSSTASRRRRPISTMKAASPAGGFMISAAHLPRAYNGSASASK